MSTPEEIAQKMAEKYGDKAIAAVLLETIAGDIALDGNNEVAEMYLEASLLLQSNSSANVT